MVISPVWPKEVAAETVISPETVEVKVIVWFTRLDVVKVFDTIGIVLVVFSNCVTCVYSAVATMSKRIVVDARIPTIRFFGVMLQICWDSCFRAFSSSSFHLF
jgi:hypothetical protein